MTSLSAIPRCTANDGPPCDALLHDPVAVLGDRHRWPHHICPDVAQASTARWATERVEATYGDGFVPTAVRAWAASWPLPVGRFSLPADVPPILAPIENFGAAAIILSPAFPFVDIVAFGIVDDHPAIAMTSDGDVEMLPASMQFVEAGWQSHRTRAFRAHAHDWWEWYGVRHRGGRPAGSTDRTLEDYVQAFRDAGQPRTLDAFVKKSNIHRDTVKRNLKSWSMNWTSFRDRYRA